MKQQVKETKDIIKTLKEAGKVFDVDYTSLTRIVYYNGREYAFYDTFLPMHEIYFLQMVKKQVPEKLPEVNRKEIIYTFTDILKKNKNKSFQGYEIDLNRAFWQFAKENKFISEDIFERGLKVGKKTRLASLGACAKKTYRFHFDGKKFLLKKDEEPKTANVYFKVALDTSKLMQELSYIAGECFLFFWCDAIFFTGETIKHQIETYLEKIKLGYKTRSVTISVKKNVSIVYSKQLINTFDGENKKIENVKEDKKPRPFFHEIKNEEYTILNNR